MSVAMELSLTTSGSMMESASSSTRRFSCPTSPGEDPQPCYRPCSRSESVTWGE